LISSDTRYSFAGTKLVALKGDTVPIRTRLKPDRVITPAIAGIKILATIDTGENTLK
jgi:hypothetical protein